MNERGTTMKFVLATATTFSATLPRYAPTRRAADMVGRTLARAGLGLVTGNPPGVDSIVSESFISECRCLGRSGQDAYRQLWLPHLRRGYFLPGSGYPAPETSLVRLRDFADWMAASIELADAAVMIGGRRGALTIARRFIDAGKPVFPIPHSGGKSRMVFDEILTTWEEAPVPGLTRSQFLTLDVPWINDTGALANLLLGTLAETADIFISYRRDDVAVAAGRLHADLAEHFGHKRVFIDLHDIAPSAAWMETIRQALAECKIGIVVIGPRWLATAEGEPARLEREDDVMREEISALLKTNKRVMPILVDGGRLPLAGEVPADVTSLTAHQATPIDNASWDAVMCDLIRSIESALAQPVCANGSKP